MDANEGAALPRGRGQQHRIDRVAGPGYGTRPAGPAITASICVSTRATRWSSAGRPDAARPPCCAASPGCGPTPPEQCCAGRRRRRDVPVPGAYLPLGDLRSVLSYRIANAPSQLKSSSVLSMTSPWATSADGSTRPRDWSKVIHPGAAAHRIRPDSAARARVIFLDESTSAIDEGQEYALYRLLRTRMPNTIIVSVTHHAGTVEQHHGHHPNSGTADGRSQRDRVRARRSNWRPHARPPGARRAIRHPVASAGISLCVPARGRAHAPAHTDPESPNRRPRSTAVDVGGQPPTVKLEYIALPSDRVEGGPTGRCPVVQGNSGCLWKSGSSPWRRFR